MYRVEDIGNAPITLALQVQVGPLSIPRVGAVSWYRSTLLRFSAGYNHLIRLDCVLVVPVGTDPTIFHL